MVVCFKYFLCSSPNFGEDEPNLTFAYFSDGLGKNQLQPDDDTPLEVFSHRILSPEFFKTGPQKEMIGRPSFFEGASC